MEGVGELVVIAVGYFVFLVALRFVMAINPNKIEAHHTSSNSRQNSKPRFELRSSSLDNSSQSSIMQSEFRGFFHLAAIGMGFFVASHNIRNIIKEGTLVGLESLVSLFSRYEVFFYWMLVLVASCLSVTWTRIFRAFHASLFVQQLCHGLFLGVLFFGTVFVILNHDWPFVPKASLLADLLVILMKIHSYMAYNRYLDGNLPASSEVSYPNFIDFLLVPTLVYEKSYPRTQKIRWSYLTEKILTAIGVFTVLHVIVDIYISPTLMNSPNESTVEVVAELVIPFTFCYMLMFYMVFDCLCNGFAELTCFGDRQFYEGIPYYMTTYQIKDWWNSTTMDEFARKWNKPVHMWLQRHIYQESMDVFKLSRLNAVWVTFLVSSILHEMFMAICFKMFRPWLFVCQMAQIPMIVIGRELKGTRLGNYMFWFGIVLGIPLLSVLYSREYYRGYSSNLQEPNQ